MSLAPQALPADLKYVAPDLTALDTPWSSVGYLTYKRTYARRLVENDPSGTTEEWEDTVQRILRATDEQLACGFTRDESERLGLYLKGLKGSVAGRFLWQLGTQTVGRLGLASLQNCAFTSVDSPRAFTWAFDFLMLGSGVGYNIQRKTVDELPRVRDDFQAPTRINSETAGVIVADSREGWVALLQEVLDCAFSKGGTFDYSTHLVRGKGAPIKGFGGVASGPEELVWGIGEISKILENRRGRKLKPVDCLDIMNIIGAVVVSGNVRRSAQIAIGDYDDIEYLNAKRWDLGNIPSWRGNSNNSVVCSDVGLLPEEFWEGYAGNGEPYGLINLDLARRIGRTGETQYPDPGVQGFNPCAEQPLENYETCCLAEIFLPRIDSREELLDIAKLLYRVNKHSLALPCHSPETAHVVHKNMRMGIGITGYLQASDEQRSWLAGTYEELRKFDEEYSDAHGFPHSVKLTTVKPSGTLSLLPGVTPGCHPAYAQHMIRRIRVASNSTLVEVCKNHGYFVEPVRKIDGSEDHTTVVVEFPFSYPDGTKTASQCTALDQLEVVKTLQRDWSDNAVSCTVYYRLEELPTIKEYLKQNYSENFKSLSFLLHSGHGFDQAPYEEITKEKYDDMVANTKLITSVHSAAFDSDDECAGGVCPVK
jgi:ribonucleoside-triphosphate reductase